MNLWFYWNNKKKPLLGLAWLTLLFVGFFAPQILINFFLTTAGALIYIFSFLSPFEPSFAYCDDYLHSFQTPPSFPSSEPVPHKCPSFPRCFADSAEVTFEYFSSLCDCYSVHILEKPEFVTDAFGNLIRDEEAAAFNKSRAADLQFCLDEKKFWSRINDLAQESKELQKKINYEYRRVVDRNTLMYWLCLGSMLLIVLFIFILIL